MEVDGFDHEVSLPDLITNTHARMDDDLRLILFLTSHDQHLHRDYLITNRRINNKNRMVFSFRDPQKAMLFKLSFPDAR
jgi:hypothetical protein